MTHSTNNVPLIHRITSFETMTKDEGLLLYRALILADPNQKSFFPALPLRASDNPNVREYVRIPKQIILRRRHNNALSLKWDVYEDGLLGEGASASIKRIKGTLVFDYQLGMRFIPKSFAAKKFLDTKIDSVVNEYSITKIMNGLSVKLPTVDEHLATMTMDFVSGENLRDLLMLKDRSSGGIKLTTDERLLITRNLLKALLELHEKGIFHRDIKPENIMVELPSFAIKIVDYGLSVLMKNMPDGRYPGTPWYAAPEVFEEHPTINQSADIFSLGQVLSLVWLADWNGAQTGEEAYFRALSTQFNNLFQEIADLAPPHLEFLNTVIYDMVRKEPEVRCPLHFALMGVDEIILERHLTRIHVQGNSDKKFDYQVEAEKGSREGALFQAELKGFGDAHPVLQSKEFPLLVKLVSSALNTIPDTKYAISAFIECSGVVTFHGLTSKQDIEEKLTALMVVYHENLNSLSNVLKRLNYLMREAKSFVNTSDEANEVYLGLLKVVNDLEALRHKMNCALTPDNIVRLNAKSEKHIAQTKEALLYFGSKISQLEKKQKPEIPLFKSYFFAIKLPEQGQGEAACNLVVIPKK